MNNQTHPPPQQYTNQSYNSGNTIGPKPNQERFQIDPIPFFYTELIPRLIQDQLIAKSSIEPLKPQFPRSYDPNAYCDYQYRAQDHSVENYTTLKCKVQGLIKA